MPKKKSNPKPPTQLDSAQVMAALRKRYPEPAFAFFEEVGNATGWRCNRHADAVAMSLYPSRGLELYGFEVKVSRTDWMKELQQPKKAEAIQRYCRRWWVVIANKAALRSEIPKNWGLMELRGNGLHTLKQAPALKHKALDAEFIAALLRRSSERINSQIDRARAEGMALGEKQGPDAHQAKVAALERSVKNLQQAIEKFEEASGIKIDAWNGGRLGKSLRSYLDCRTTSEPHKEYEFLARVTEQHIERLQYQVERFRGDAKRLREATAESQEKEKG